MCNYSLFSSYNLLLIKSLNDASPKSPERKTNVSKEVTNYPESPLKRDNFNKKHNNIVVELKEKDIPCSPVEKIKKKKNYSLNEI